MSAAHKSSGLKAALKVCPLAAYPTVKAASIHVTNMRHQGFARRTKEMRGIWPGELIKAREDFVLKGLDTVQIAEIIGMDKSAVWQALNGAYGNERIAQVIHAVRIAHPVESRFALTRLEPQVLEVRELMVKQGFTSNTVAAKIGFHPVTVRKVLSGISAWDGSPCYYALRRFLTRRSGKTHFRNTRPAR